jgi:uncharacterized protein
MSKRVLISLHDITPFHLPRLRLAERLLARWGVPKISYLFVPAYHQLALPPGNSLLSFYRQWAREKKVFTRQWLLHGYYHLEPAVGTGEPKPELTLKDRLKRTFLTAGEGEFLDLSAAEIRERIRKGKRDFREFFHCDPEVFVAPAWLFNPGLMPILKEQQFMITEDHSFIYLLEKDIKLSAPVITWATRTWLRKSISRIGCPLLSRLWAGKDLVRIALHPFDFDYSATRQSIEAVIKDTLNQREPILYSQCW